MECGCSQTARWDRSVHPAPSFITSICFLRANPSCGKITAVHLGKAAAWFRSRGTHSAVPLSTLSCWGSRCCISRRHTPKCLDKLHLFFFLLLIFSLSLYLPHHVSFITLLLLSSTSTSILSSHHLSLKAARYLGCSSPPRPERDARPWC